MINEDLEKHVLAAIEFSKTQEFLTCSLLQRHCKWGYNRAHMVMEQLIERGIVNKPQHITDGRHVVVKSQDELSDKLCEYCPLEKKGVYSVPGGFAAGCEGSRCDDAYENYLEKNENA